MTTDNLSNNIFNRIINKVDVNKHIQQIHNDYDKIQEAERLKNNDLDNIKEIIYKKLKEKYPNYYIDIEYFTYTELSKRQIYARKVENIGVLSLFTLGIALPWEISRARKIWKETNPIYFIEYKINFRKSMIIEEEWSSFKNSRNRN